ncbi:hypothetical protein D9758_012443 [Tetrapyrgos nigripes]|uniref:Uncharacterized protein n=1 Tax=Tetrapyrgos nigripes TaxID=182062 RepID=A0A8H5FUN9_9AGAR|nr:hypothetical protein D9758_012443 [Tetrapyrgos nigripes]
MILAFTNGFAPNSGDVGDVVRLNNPALFVLTSIWPLKNDAWLQGSLLLIQGYLEASLIPQ